MDIRALEEMVVRTRQRNRELAKVKHFLNDLYAFMLRQRDNVKLDEGYTSDGDANSSIMDCPEIDLAEVEREAEEEVHAEWEIEKLALRNAYRENLGRKEGPEEESETDESIKQESDYEAEIEQEVENESQQGAEDSDHDYEEEM